jgi:hypothetical protein
VVKEQWKAAMQQLFFPQSVAVIDLTIVNVAMPLTRGTFGVSLDAVT